MTEEELSAVVSGSFPALPEPPPASKPRRLVVLCHGIDGEPADLDEVRAQLVACDASIDAFDASVNEKGKTHHGVDACAERLWLELRAHLRRQRGSELALSMVGHSLGGLILQGVAKRLHVWLRTEEGAAMLIALDCFVCIASPMLGVRRINTGAHKGFGWLMGRTTSLMRAGLRLFRGQAGRDLLLDSDVLDRLADEEGCAALASFRRRLAVANTTGDWVCPFDTSTLLDADESRRVQRAFADEGESVLWTAEEAAALGRDLPPTMRLLDDAVRAEHSVPRLFVGALPPDWDAAPTLRSHRTWDDRLAGAPRARRVPSLLRRLRGVGEWEVLPVRFSRRFGSPISPSFLGGVLSPHVDIAAIPKQRKTDAGVEAVRYIARAMCTARAGAPTQYSLAAVH